MNSALQFRSTASAPFSDDHLSDDQIDDQLIGDLAAEPAAHLATCSDCSHRVALAAAPITSFDSVTMAWSERRSATLPLPDLSGQKPLWQRHMSSAMACFTFVLGVALINANHEVAFKAAALHSAQPASTLQAVTPAPALTETASINIAPPEAQISADNLMLKAVDTELQPSAESPSALGLEPVSDPAPRPRTTVSVQD
jgi:hypothetical protein